MDQKLSELLSELKDAINEALWKSERVAAAMALLEQEGLDVQIAIDAALVDGVLPALNSPVAAQGETDAPVQLMLDATDVRFLRKLKISVETGITER
jgi:hypothetical protein